MDRLSYMLDFVRRGISSVDNDGLGGIVITVMRAGNMLDKALIGKFDLTISYRQPSARSLGL